MQGLKLKKKTSSKNSVATLKICYTDVKGHSESAVFPSRTAPTIQNLNKLTAFIMPHGMDDWSSNLQGKFNRFCQ